MLIQRGELIAGLAALDAREIMRALHGRAYSLAAVADLRSVSPDDAAALLATLRDGGLIEPCDNAGLFVLSDGEDMTRGDRPELWTTTIAGTALPKARVGVPMPRSKAQALLDGVVERAAEVNASDRWLDTVEKVVLYGSFAVNGVDSVGDVDVAVWLAFRFPHQEYVERQHQLIIDDDAYAPGILEQVSYARTKLLRYLRGLSPKIDLVDHSADQPLPPGATTSLVYERHSPDED